MTGLPQPRDDSRVVKDREWGGDMWRRARLWVFASIALAAFAVPAANAKVGANSSPTAVSDWNRIATSTLVLIPPSAGGAPSALQISLGMVQGAVYDAVNAITPKHHRPYLLNRRFSSQASGDAAVATAASGVLTNIISTVPQGITFANRDALLESVATQYATALDAIPDSLFKAQGVAAGNAAAAAMIDARQDDGRFGPSPWDQSTGPGRWQPLLPNGTSPLDPTPWVGGVRAVPVCRTQRSLKRQGRTTSQAMPIRPTSTRSRCWAVTGCRWDPHDSHRRPDALCALLAERRRSGPAVERDGAQPDRGSVLRLRSRRQCPPTGHDEPERRRRVDQLLARQVPLRLLAPVDRDSAGGFR
jgi:hypothetical protein